LRKTLGRPGPAVDQVVEQVVEPADSTVSVALTYRSRWAATTRRRHRAKDAPAATPRPWPLLRPRHGRAGQTPHLGAIRAASAPAPTRCRAGSRSGYAPAGVPDGRRRRTSGGPGGSSFVDHQAQDAGREHTHLRRGRTAVFEVDPLAEQAQRTGWRRASFDLGHVLLVDAVGGMGQQLRQCAVVGQDQQALGVLVQASDREHARLGGHGSITVGRPCGSAAVVMTRPVCSPRNRPIGCHGKQDAVDLHPRRGHVDAPPRVATSPSTVTRPAAIISSHTRREPCPARASTFWSRSATNPGPTRPVPGTIHLSAIGASVFHRPILALRAGDPATHHRRGYFPGAPGYVTSLDAFDSRVCLGGHRHPYENGNAEMLPEPVSQPIELRTPRQRPLLATCGSAASRSGARTRRKSWRGSCGGSCGPTRHEIQPGGRRVNEYLRRHRRQPFRPLYRAG